MLRWYRWYRQDLIDLQAAASYRGYRFPRLWAFWVSTQWLFEDLLERTWCRWFGHKWHCIGDISPESGQEILWCSRCGNSHNIIYY